MVQYDGERRHGLDRFDDVVDVTRAHGLEGVVTSALTLPIDRDAVVVRGAS
jgi:hypothetical protein